MIYLIGSLQNPSIPYIASSLRNIGFEVFDDWFAAGPKADDYWQEYELARGRTFDKALEGLAADHIFRFDLTHINRATSGLLVLPAGKSGHLELGYIMGQGKPGYILLSEENSRWDVMYRFSDKVFADLDALLLYLKTT